jgi:3-(3-hydroxy-phenyl)propionate hydroxylase
MAGRPGFDLRFGAFVTGLREDGETVVARLRDGETVAGSYVVGADGAHSAVRRAAGIGFEGFTWPERFLVLSTPFEFRDAIPDLADVAYYADPEEWFFLLRVPGLWRAMFPVPAEVTDAAALSEDYAAGRMARIVPGRSAYDIKHRTLYRVHQRVAATFRKGRLLLAGDAAHINNPLGGMGLNGGIHDAVNLAEKLAEVWHGRAGAELLDLYDRQRRRTIVDHVQTQSIRNKKNLEAKTPADQEAFRRTLAENAADPARGKAFLMEVSMIGSLRRAAAIV